MHSRSYLVYDGLLRNSNTPVFKSTNRAFRYGDAVFETVRVHKGEPLFWNHHYERLMLGMSVMRFSLKGFPSRNRLKEQICNLVVKSRIFYDARVRITVFRSGEGTYTPISNAASWIIEANSLNQTGYDFSGKGVMVDIYNDILKQHTPFSSFKNGASQIYVLAGLYAKENLYDDVLILNSEERAVESVSSSLFWVKNGTIYTPLISSGSVDGVMRRQIVDIASKNRIPVIENSGASIEELMQADEIFLTNVIVGIKWVGALRERRFYCEKSKELYHLLNNYIRDDHL
ncbi:aminotransferase class IV [Marinilabiliaceae bacterium ANBcel2]|nr:aminotransferase class IV [Marinilabiliaceae bacterium ANBcel2]